MMTLSDLESLLQQMQTHWDSNFTVYATYKKLINIMRILWMHVQCHVQLCILPPYSLHLNVINDCYFCYISCYLCYQNNTDLLSIDLIVKNN